MNVLTETESHYTLVAEGIESVELPQNSVLITDEALDVLYPLEVAHKILVPRGEKAKSLEVAKACWEEMHRLGCDRESTVVALGGGAVTDLGGFVAATYMRGIDSIYIPTTLLGMVDAAIGGKVGVNLESGKSIVGAFHLPRQVYLIPQLLRSLPVEQMRSGAAEVIKYGVIRDPDLFYQLEEEGFDAIPAVIERCAAIKSAVVAEDPKERGVRAILNYGHTFAHALETATGYQRYLHGEAVAIGMSCAVRAAFELGWVDNEVVKRQDALIQKFELPISPPEEIDANLLIDLMRRDKKSIEGKIRLILPKEIGRVAQYIAADEEVLRKAWKRGR